MSKLSVELENCYGIVNLIHEFDFSKHRTIALYAPNGMMKTSFSKTFMKISEGKRPEEKLFNRTPKYIIQEDGVDIEKEKIFVIESLNEKFQAERITTLLVDDEAREKYEELTKGLLSLQKDLTNKLNKLSGVVKTNNNIENTIQLDFGSTSFFEHIEAVDLENVEDDFSHISYVKLFDEKVLNLLKDQDFAEKINKYTEKYQQLLSESKYYKKGIFNPTKANNILKATKKENFFKAEHSILLHGEEKAFATYEEFEKTLEDEKAKIFADQKLQDIQKQISNGVKSINEFEALLEQYPDIITELRIENIDALKKKMWLSYYKKEEILFKSLQELYQTTKTEIEEIEKKAHEQITKWEDVVEEFKKRFSLPFEVVIQNKESAILGKETPNIDFKFIDPVTGVQKSFSRDSLGSLQVLSQGEKRALYLLYVIFEIKSRMEQQADTFIIVDDIADSFDYKNKYAIVEYLNEISNTGQFKQIILTHNFDFFRTIQERVLGSAKWHNSLIVDKDIDEALTIVSAGSKNVTDPFQLWKNNYQNDLTKFIALIPFVRNVIEYAHGSDGDEYDLLTSCLHIKSDSSTITKKDIQEVFETVGKIYHGKVVERETDSVLSSIYQCADDIISTGKKDGIVLEDKIVLSIAIRLKAEEYMWDSVTDKTAINGSQTGKLFERYKNEFQRDTTYSERIKVLTRMSIMTPENIHLNSFMYEPLLDMAYGHLVELYNDVKTLN